LKPRVTEEAEEFVPEVVNGFVERETFGGNGAEVVVFEFETRLDVNM
jgi:hypothetical protein